MNKEALSLSTNSRMPLDSSPLIESNHYSPFSLEIADPKHNTYVLHIPSSQTSIIINLDQKLLSERQQQVRSVISQALRTIPLDELTDIQRRYLTIKYGLAGDETKSTKEVAKLLGVTRKSVDGTENGALKQCGLLEIKRTLSSQARKTPISRKANETEAREYSDDFENYYQLIAEDLTSDVFMKALESTVNGNFRHSGVPKIAWFFSIAHNLLYDHTRNKNSKTIALTDEIGDDLDVYMQIERKLNTESALAALQLLTETQKDVIILRFMAELSLKETADVLGKSENNVKVLQHKGIVRLRQILKHKYPELALLLS